MSETRDEENPHAQATSHNRVMHWAPSQRRHSTTTSSTNLTPRRVSSAPELRAPSGSSSVFASLDSPISPLSPSSDLPGRRSHDPQGLGTNISRIPPTDQLLPTRSVTEPLPTSEPLSQESPHDAPQGPSQEARELREEQEPPQELQQEPPSLESATRRLEEMRRVIRRLQRRRRRSGLSRTWFAVRAFFGYGPDGTVARRDLMSLIARMLFGAGQIGATIALLFIAAHVKSPTENTVEWRACRRPLGEWCSVWCVRVVLGCLMAFWGYRRKYPRSTNHAEWPDPEAPDEVAPQLTGDATESRSSTPRRPTPHESPRVRRGGTVTDYTYARLTTLLSFFSLTWFVTAHVLLYTSVKTCRFSAPHLWWLTFGIVCIGYLLMVEVILVAFVVFILGPLIFLLLNLFLICMGRQPLRRANHINPEVGKLSPKTVDLIPLVLYIPAPVPKVAKTANELSNDAQAGQSENMPASPANLANEHSYPPVEQKSADPNDAASMRSQTTRQSFTFRRIRFKKSTKSKTEKGKDKQSGNGDEERHDYEDKWEKGDYPFVKLEGNRASCAICLCDFEEPRRVRYSIDSRPAEDLDVVEKEISTSPPEAPQQGDRLRLTDAGTGAQPLRLLPCAHVFHKSCLDPWLTEVSGRCPVCQRRVEVSDTSKPEENGQSHRDDWS